MQANKRTLSVALLMLGMIAPSYVTAEQGAKSGTGEGGETYVEPVYVDAAPTLEDTAPTLQDVESAEASEASSPAPAGTEGEPAPTVEAEAAPAANAFATEHCVIDITSLVPVDGEAAEADATEVAPAASAPPGDEIASGEGGVGGLDCVEMVDALPTRVGNDGALEPLADTSSTEALLLTRLQERRSKLEAEESALLLREDLLRAAELRLEEQAALLEASTSALAESVDAAAAKEAEEIAGLAVLFETMKPKDAAAILAGLPDDTLMALAKLVSARKLAPIMAELPPDRAGELTVMLAQSE